MDKKLQSKFFFQLINDRLFMLTSPCLFILQNKVCVNIFRDSDFFRLLIKKKKTN